MYNRFDDIKNDYIRAYNRWSEAMRISYDLGKDPNRMGRIREYLAQFNAEDKGLILGTAARIRVQGFPSVQREITELAGHEEADVNTFAGDQYEEISLEAADKEGYHA